MEPFTDGEKDFHQVGACDGSSKGPPALEGLGCGGFGIG
jgi:hypothetical protein